MESKGMRKCDCQWFHLPPCPLAISFGTQINIDEVMDKLNKAIAESTMIPVSILEGTPMTSYEIAKIHQEVFQKEIEDYLATRPNPPHD